MIVNEDKMTECWGKISLMFHCQVTSKQALNVHLGLIENWKYSFQKSKKWVLEWDLVKQCRSNWTNKKKHRNLPLAKEKCKLTYFQKVQWKTSVLEWFSFFTSQSTHFKEEYSHFMIPNSNEHSRQIWVEMNSIQHYISNANEIR